MLRGRIIDVYGRYEQNGYLFGRVWETFKIVQRQMIFMGNELLERLKAQPHWKNVVEKVEKGIIRIEPVKPLKSDYLDGLTSVDSPSVEQSTDVKHESTDQSVDNKVPSTEFMRRSVDVKRPSVEHKVPSTDVIKRSVDKRYKTVQLSVEFHAKLRNLQMKGESVEQTILRLIEGKRINE